MEESSYAGGHAIPFGRLIAEGVRFAPIYKVSFASPLPLSWPGITRGGSGGIESFEVSHRPRTAHFSCWPLVLVVSALGEVFETNSFIRTGSSNRRPIVVRWM